MRGQATTGVVKGKNDAKVQGEKPTAKSWHQRHGARGYIWKMHWKKKRNGINEVGDSEVQTNKSQKAGKTLLMYRSGTTQLAK